jgi:hypothetical protein
MNEKPYHSFARAGAFLDRHARIAAAILLALLFLCALVQAARKPFWYDEIFTYLSAALPGWSGVWGFYAHGADTTSPLSSLIVHATLPFGSNPEITTRIPFMLAFVFACLCLCLFMRRRYPPVYALAALLAPAAIPAFFYFSSEIRAYALVLAGAGLAMVCWQSLASNPTHRAANWNAFGLWLGLAFAICAHTFAIFLFIPFALAQLTADLEVKKLNLGVWLPLLLFPLGILPVLHGEMVASHAYRGTFFSKPHLRMLPGVFEAMFTPVDLCGTLLLFAVLLLVARWRRASGAADAGPTGLTGPEIVFAVSLAALPLYMLPASMLIGVFRWPYVVPAFLGIVLCLVAAVAELARNDSAAGDVPAAAPAVALIAALLVLGCARNSPLSHWRTLARLERVHTNNVRSYNQQGWVRLIADSSLPVAISDQKLFAQAFFYWPDPLKRRLWYPTDLALADRYPNAVTEQLNLLRAGRFVPFPTMDWKMFSAAHPHFLLVVYSLEDTWLPAYLAHQPRDRVKIELLGPDFSGPNGPTAPPAVPVVYDVQILNPAETQPYAGTGR